MNTPTTLTPYPYTHPTSCSSAMTVPGLVTDARGDVVRLSLVRAVEALCGQPWDIAREQCDVVAYVDDGYPSDENECACGQTGLRHLHTVRSRATGRELEPIGSSCIDHFGSAEMLDQARRLRCMHEMRAIAATRVLSLTRRGRTPSATTGAMVLTGRRELARRHLLTAYELGGIVSAEEYERLSYAYGRRTPASASEQAWVDERMSQLTEWALASS
ncbi:hypothetical protein O4157_14840 [Gordonia amicalis]|uniref:hypothetical protein n=1 Tax=Gordonia amicalis TaxID=89053 RepID=UPI0022B53682|nr:hypothetical protein [Gordonia amicalis]MCZ4652701.1 hypothetical protein [Gordonia amicalis]